MRKTPDVPEHITWDHCRGHLIRLGSQKETSNDHKEMQPIRKGYQIHTKYQNKTQHIKKYNITNNLYLNERAANALIAS